MKATLGCVIPACLRTVLLAFSAALPLLTQAHVTSTGLAHIDLREEAQKLSLALVVNELDPVAREVFTQVASGNPAAAAQVGQWLQGKLILTQGGRDCTWQRIKLEASPADPTRISVQAKINCQFGAPQATLSNRLHEVFGEHYRTIASVTDASGSRVEYVMDKDKPVANVSSGQRSGRWALFLFGMAHIASGLDHLLFVFVLILGAVAVVAERTGKQKPGDGLRVAAPLMRGSVRRSIIGSLRGLMRRLAWLVSAFTLAHSASLALATVQWFHLPSALVEPLIAASIVWVALVAWQDLRAGRPAASAPKSQMAIVFAFGLVHGWAFAEALTALQLHGRDLFWGLLSFNLGVEAAQLLVLLVSVPVLYAMRRNPIGQKVLPWLALASAGSGMVWLVQRIAGG